MTLTISNHQDVSTITPARVEASIKEARAEYAGSKDHAARAAAHAYMVWYYTRSANAHSTMREWLEKEISAKNDEIEKYNKYQDTLRKQAKLLIKGKVNAADWNGVEVPAIVGAEGVVTETVDLAALAERSPADWTKHRKVRIDLATGEFAAVTRFVFGFFLRGQSSLVSRYAKVAEWIHARFEGQQISDYTEISDAIKANGGFESVLEMQRNGGVGGGDTEADQKAIDEEVAEIAREAMNSTDAIQTVEMEMDGVSPGNVTLLARFNGKVLEIIAGRSISENELDRTLAAYSNTLPLGASHQTQFVGRVLGLGALVSAGEKTKHTVDGTTSGQSRLAERVLSLVSEGSSTGLVVSARLAEASVIVKAFPIGPDVSLGTIDSPMMLSASDTASLQKCLKDPRRYPIIDITAVHAGGGLTWRVDNAVLLQYGRSAASTIYDFQAVADEEYKPLDIDDFKPQVTCSVDWAELAKFHKSFTEWTDDKTVTNSKKLIKLVFFRDQMTCGMDDSVKSRLRISGSLAVRTALSFRLRDLRPFIELLVSQNTKSFDIEADHSGLLCCKWSDDLGRYAIYLPTGTANHLMQSKRVGQMTVNSTQVEAA